jgi:hypothetical protein
MNALEYKYYWSDKVNDNIINDFTDVSENVFQDQSLDKDAFIKKYIDNPYGKSLLVIVYDNFKPIAARGFWRNDINDIEAYQPVDTAVTTSYRGKGIFKQMTIGALEMVSSESLIYNFPNANSYPGYISLGWRLVAEYRLRLFKPCRFEKEHQEKISNTEVEWRYYNKDCYKYIKCGKKYYLVSLTKRSLCYLVVSEITQEISQKYSRIRFLHLLFYHSKIKTIYNLNREPLRVISKNSVKCIPIWKADSVF